MDIRIYCANCQYEWLNTHLAFADPEETCKPVSSVSLALPATPCVQCCAMQWQAQFTRTIERETPENVAQQALARYVPLDRARWLGMQKQTCPGRAIAPAILPEWVTRDRDGCQEAEENDAW
jgi:hypothetical protein